MSQNIILELKSYLMLLFYLSARYDNACVRRGIVVFECDLFKDLTYALAQHLDYAEKELEDQ